MERARFVNKQDIAPHPMREHLCAVTGRKKKKRTTGSADIEGTGILVMEFYRILKLVEKCNRGHHLFFLYENVASMNKCNRDYISRLFECQPAIWAADHYSPQKRLRFFWGNIPGIHSDLTKFSSPVSRASGLVENDETYDLQSFLFPSSERKALVEKIRTVTTHSNSLAQEGGQLPLIEEGDECSLWIQEIENPLHRRGSSHPICQAGFAGEILECSCGGPDPTAPLSLLQHHSSPQTGLLLWPGLILSSNSGLAKRISPIHLKKGHCVTPLHIVKGCLEEGGESNCGQKLPSSPLPMLRGGLNFAFHGTLGDKI
ncbi:DNMT3A [Cordylochernes scorpioides]|uniref:DNMT3A n=1 Tax=Cordylochernes scorpioides TaxID=51811 RepID=A0ABY6LS58_9ARAC|nr:DNMT3A [Cordylochernes scorpioides]